MRAPLPSPTAGSRSWSSKRVRPATLISPHWSVCSLRPPARPRRPPTTGHRICGAGRRCCTAVARRSRRTPTRSCRTCVSDIEHRRIPDVTRLVLASASPARRSVLRAAGIEPIVRASDVDEDAVAAALPARPGPRESVVELARAKARAVAATLAGDGSADLVVVGCDSMLLIDGELQGKPHTAEVAQARWQAMAGNNADLLTGHCVLRLVSGAVTAEALDCSATTVHLG